MKYVLVVFLGGGLGATVRYLLATALAFWHLPIPTLVANLLGCFLIGLSMPIFLAKGGSTELRLFFVTGVLGGLTTFSTFTYETLQLAENTTLIAAFCNIAVNVLGGLALAMFGAYLAH